MAKIGDTEAFKTLNVMIDQKIESVRFYVARLKEDMKTLTYGLSTQPKTTITSRVSYDDTGRHSYDTGFNFHELKIIRDHIEEVLNLESAILELQRYKLRLANDYDFTRGNNLEQRQVFGNEVNFEDCESHD